MEAEGEGALELLPQELWYHILSFLPQKDWLQASCVSWEWRLLRTVGQLREVDLCWLTEKKAEEMGNRWKLNLTTKQRFVEPLIYFLQFFARDCPNLHTLRLPRHTNDLHMHHIPKTLFHLSLRLSCVTDAGITIACQRAPALQSLSVSFTRCSDASLPRIPPSVTSLNLSFTEVTDAGLTRLPRTLKTLDLKSTKITDKGMKNLPPALESLDVSMTKVGNAGIALLSKNLRCLCLGTKTKVTADGLSRNQHLEHCLIR